MEEAGRHCPVNLWNVCVTMPERVGNAISPYRGKESSARRKGFTPVSIMNPSL